MNQSKESALKVKFCPVCGSSMADGGSLVNEYWVAKDTFYYCLCRHCYWKGEIIESDRIVSTEPDS